METQTFARWYAKRGIPIFPCHTIEEGACSCGKASCSSPGKHPVASCVPNGVLGATTDLASIDQWWALFPDSNIGIATGQASGLVVIDIDPDHGGLDAWDNLESINEAVENTWIVETGSGGFHIYFLDDSGLIRNSASSVGPGIDVRGEGGYVVAPPSRHMRGSYSWTERWNPQTTPQPSPVPEWLLSRLVGNLRALRPQGASPMPERVTEGGRNTWLASAAGTMRRRNFSFEAIEAALQVENRKRCVPPLDRDEVRRIAWSIDRYPAAVSNLTAQGIRAHA